MVIATSGKGATLRFQTSEFKLISFQSSVLCQNLSQPSLQAHKADAVVSFMPGYHPILVSTLL